MKKAILIILLLLTSTIHSENIQDITKVLSIVESNNNPKAIGDSGKAYGILQIHDICVRDVNRVYGTHYTHKDAFSIEKSYEIFNLYINHGINIFYKKHNRYPSENEIVRMWNGGVYNGYLKKSTEKYYRKYLLQKQKTFDLSNENDSIEVATKIIEKEIVLTELKDGKEFLKAFCFVTRDRVNVVTDVVLFQRKYKLVIIDGDTKEIVFLFRSQPRNNGL